MAQLIPEDIPAQIGPYRLRSYLGDGGVGSVFYAEQREPVRREVALKVLRASEVSADSIRRLYKEQRALALMSHHNITQVYDAGELPDGRPFIVMEYIPGGPITEFCDRCHFSAAQRVRLFLQVCRAIQHAHEKGVIHRDLKPHNVLAFLQDGAPVVKVIDFGLGKASEGMEGEETIGTLEGALPGAPQYLSPEQLTGDREATDTRADVYSLGVILYELIAGALPDDYERAPFRYIQRACSGDFPPPSRRWRKDPERLAAIAASRGVTVKAWRKQTRGALDWIISQTLEVDVDRRCQSAAQLDLWLQHYLDDKPIQGMTISWPQRLESSIAKYRAGRGAFLGAVAALALAALGLGWSWTSARDAEARLAQNQRESAIARLETEALTELLRAAASGAEEPAAALARAEREAVADNPNAQAALHQALAEAYWSLGSQAAAESHARAALSLREQFHGPDHPETRALRQRLGLAAGSKSP